MRLINVKTLKLEEFLDHPPPYAILSHTWGDEAEELTFRDVQDGNVDRPGIGAVKFRGCCQQAEKDELEYAWIDTCCIDKTNLVELSEAINSMFRWYSDASVCYTYLSDVPGDDNAPKEGSKFYTSRWFRRGWTLQELLAPEHVRFYNSDWVNIGNKGSLCAAIGKITGVPRHFLLGITDLHTASVAQRMSWAASRDTKKKEDLAYCLLGIFDVTMPLIYGEGGEQAFFRLQEQIMKTTRDDSILAWGLMSAAQPPVSDDSSDHVTAGRILAAAPSDFANSGHIVPREQTSTSLNALDMTGGSLRINLSLYINSDGDTMGLLNCRPENDDEHVVGIPLVKISPLSEEYVRPKGDFAVLQPLTAASCDTPTPIHIKHESDKKVSKVSSSDAKKQQYWLYEDDQFAELNLSLIDVEPKASWDRERALIRSVIESDDGVPHRTLARFRHGCEDGTSPDFLMFLEFEETDSTAVKAKCCVMVCHRNAESDEIIGKIDYLLERACGARSASNGLLDLSVDLEPVAQQPIFIIRPKRSAEQEAALSLSTVNATTELEKFDLMLEFTIILQDRAQIEDREQKLGQVAAEKRNKLEKIRTQREAMEEEIRKLEEKKRLLLDDEITLRAHLYQLGDEQTEMIEKQQDADERWLQAQKRWAKLHHSGYSSSGSGNSNSNNRSSICSCSSTEAVGRDLDNMASRTPLLWASEKGDTETVRLLLYQGADVTAADRRGQTAFSVASANGHLDVVRLLLATDQIDINARDDEAGQTPLCWAAENGFTGLAELLLETGKADINAKDKQGWTALRWAMEKKNETLTRLLVGHGAARDTLITAAAATATSGSREANAHKTADYSKALDSRLLDMFARTGSMGVIRGKAVRTVSDEKKPRSRTWFNLEGKKAQQVSAVVNEPESPCERRSTT